MAQINLLGQDSRSGDSALIRFPLYLVRVLIVLFIALLGYWAYLFAQSKIAIGDIADTQEEIKVTQKELLEDGSRKELIARQGQLTSLNGLLKDHESWSKLLPELARVTLRSARYMSFSADGNGSARMVVNVPNYNEMDKFLQAFNSPEFNGKINHISVSSVSKVQQGDIQMVRFEINVKYDKEFLKQTGSNDLSILR